MLSLNDRRDEHLVEGSERRAGGMGQTVCPLCDYEPLSTQQLDLKPMRASHRKDVLANVGSIVA